MIAPPFASEKRESINQKLKERIIITGKQIIFFVAISLFLPKDLFYIYLSLKEFSCQHKINTIYRKEGATCKWVKICLYFIGIPLMIVS